MATTTKQNTQYCTTAASIDANIGPWDSISAYTTWLSETLGVDTPQEGVEILVKDTSTGKNTRYRYEVVSGTARWVTLNDASLFYGLVTDADALNSRANYGVYFLMTAYLKGLLTVSYDFNNVVVQHLLANQTPVYTDDGLYYVSGSSYLTRRYQNGAWSNWTFVTGSSVVPVEGITLNHTSASIAVGETLQLIATITPSNATSQVVTWTSGDTDYATVEDGLVTAVAEGSVSIAATCGGHSAICTLTVTASGGTVTDPVTVTLAYADGSSSSMGTLGGDGEYTSGSLVTVSATEVSGYDFVGWYNASSGGTLVSSEASYSFYPTNNVTLYAVYQASSVETAKLTVLGKYGIVATATQDDTVATTTGGYTTANGIEETFNEGSVVVSQEPTVMGETFQGWQLNGSDVTSPITLSQDSVLVPKVAGNLAYAKLSGGVWSSSLTVSTDSVHYRTNVFPVQMGKSLIITIPNHASGTVKIRTWYCSRDWNYYSDASGLLSIELDANCQGTITPPVNGFMALHLAYASDYTATVFDVDDIKGVQVNYAGTEAWSIPAFYYKQVADLGALSSTSYNNTWNQSAALYNGYMVTISATARKFIIFNTATDTIAGSVTNDSYYSDMHCNNASFLSVKYDESDYYPLLITCNHDTTGPDALVILRLAGTTPTSFTVQKVCTWTMSNIKTIDVVANGNTLYIKFFRMSGVETITSGYYKVTAFDFTDPSIFVDATYDISEMIEAGEAIYMTNYYISITQDLTLVPQTGRDDILVTSFGPITASQSMGKVAGLWFMRTSSVSEGATLIGYLPINRIMSDHEPDGIVYAGDGVFYIVLINSSHAYLYKFIMTIPEDNA